jgi:hypothetical protein
MSLTTVCSRATSLTSLFRHSQYSERGRETVCNVCYFSVRSQPINNSRTLPPPLSAVVPRGNDLPAPSSSFAHSSPSSAECFSIFYTLSPLLLLNIGLLLLLLLLLFPRAFFRLGFLASIASLGGGIDDVGFEAVAALLWAVTVNV